MAWVRLAVLSVLLAHVLLAGAQLSKPVAHDSNMDTTGNKYLQRAALDDGR